MKGNPEKFCLGIPESWALESGIHLKSTKDWSPEPKFHYLES